MAYEEKLKQGQKPHTVIMEERGKLSVTGVEDVERFDEDEMIMLTSKGGLVVRGSGLHMDRLSLDVGEVCIAGLITDISYEETAPSGSLWSRLFG
ncbi:MAG: YabP/YqfC family sporulation protein [Oscillospiraceae bacterium]